MTKRWSIARQLFALQVLVVTLLVAVGTTGAVLLARKDARNAAVEEVKAVAETIALSPAVVDGLHSSDPTAALQPWAEATRKATGTDFIVVMAPDRTRYTHPTTRLIGCRSPGTSTARSTAEPWSRSIGGASGTPCVPSSRFSNRGP